MFNANNYGYNPYGTYIPQRPIQQPMQNTAELNRPMLNGKQVESIDVVKAMDIPLDGSISYFPIADGSAIITKNIQLDGTSKITIYKPEKESIEQNKYLVYDDLDDIKADIKDIKKELKNIKKENKKKDDIDE